jgi:tetratricopeptide (TPR) repeat protein
MPAARGPVVGWIAVFLIHIAILVQLTLRVHPVYPPMFESLRSPKTELQDVIGAALGMRRLVADLAWIQTLQYYGTPELGQTETEEQNGGGRYPDFLSYCQRVADIDPYFTYVYYYGGASLGWNLNRLSEAEALLKDGIARNPGEWRLPQYLAGLAYQKDHDVANLIKFLESVANDPNSPLLMRALLANLYKKQRLYDKALQLWEQIYETGDPVYASRAVDQFKEIRRLQHAQHLDRKTPRLVH